MLKQSDHSTFCVDAFGEMGWFVIALCDELWSDQEWVWGLCICTQKQIEQNKLFFIYLLNMYTDYTPYIIKTCLFTNWVHTYWLFEQCPPFNHIFISLCASLKYTIPIVTTDNKHFKVTMNQPCTDHCSFLQKQWVIVWLLAIACVCVCIESPTAPPAMEHCYSTNH